MSAATLVKAGVVPGLTPAGWFLIAIGLIFAGVATLWWFSEEPIETWMKEGPLSGNTTDIPESADSAYYRLLSLLTGISATLSAYSHPDDEVSESPNIGEDEEQGDDPSVAKRQADSVLTLESPVPGLFDEGQVFDIQVALQLHKRRLITFDDWVRRKRPPLSLGSFVLEEEDRDQHILLKERTKSGYNFYLKTPEPEVTKQLVSTMTEEFFWQTRVQIQIEGESGTSLVFPAPLPNENFDFDPKRTEYAEVDFSKRGQDYWYTAFVEHQL